MSTPPHPSHYSQLAPHIEAEYLSPSDTTYPLYYVTHTHTHTHSPKTRTTNTGNHKTWSNGHMSASHDRTSNSNSMTDSASSRPHPLWYVDPSPPPRTADYVTTTSNLQTPSHAVHARILAPAGGGPGGGVLARLSAPTSTFTRWALVTM
jgi:hypothetical protein